MRPDFDTDAQEWVIRAQHPDFEDWDGLGAWMAADVRHADAFNRLSLLDQDIASAVVHSPPLQAEILPLPVRERPSWRGWAIAASLAFVAVPAGVLLQHAKIGAGSPSELAIATRPGETRTLVLPDGTNIAMAGGSRLVIDKVGRRVAMDEGLATFGVEHDAAHPFAVTLGDTTVTDVGTVFEIRHRSGESIIGVGQGEVRVDGAGAQPIRVVAGQQLRLSSRAQPEMHAIPDGSVGQWKHGVLEYDDTTIASIAADIQNLTGTRITVSPAIGNRRFAGTIAVAGDMGSALQHIGPLLGVAVERRGNAWALEPPSHAVRR